MDTSPTFDTSVHDLRYTPPYDWDSILSFLAARAIPGVEVVSRHRYSRAIAIDGAKGVIRVEPVATHRARLTVHFPDPASMPAIIGRVRRLFDFDADPGVIDSHLALDQMLAPFVAERPGLRVPGAWDGFELAVRAVLGQQITVAVAKSLAGGLVRACGEALPPALRCVEGVTHLFPTPTQLENANLSVLGMPRSRAATLSSLAAAVKDDPALLTARRTLEEAVARLRSMPGVGEWTAQYIAMRALHESDAFPTTDIGLQRALTDADGKRPSPAQLLVRTEKWRPWRAYAALHIWTSQADSSGAASQQSGDGGRRAA